MEFGLVPPAEGEPYFVVLGDSNSVSSENANRWPELLESSTGVRVVNMSIGGALTAGPSPCDGDGVTPFGFSRCDGESQFRLFQEIAPPGGKAVVIIALGGGNEARPGRDVHDVIDLLEWLRETVLMSSHFEVVDVYFLEVLRARPGGLKALIHNHIIDEVNTYLARTYGPKGRFIEFRADVAEYVDDLHIGAAAHRGRANRVKTHLIPGSDPILSDTDTDGVPDGVEFFFGLTDPLLADTNGDGLGDSAEYGD